MSTPLSIRVRRGSALERLLTKPGPADKTDRVHAMAERYEALTQAVESGAMTAPAPQIAPEVAPQGRHQAKRR